MTGRRRNPVKTLFKVEKLEQDSVIIIRAGSAIDKPEFLKQITNTLANRGLNKVIILRLQTLNDFLTINREQMERLGWVRKELPENEPAPEPNAV